MVSAATVLRMVTDKASGMRPMAAVAILALVMPLLLGAAMVGNCWALGRTQKDCDPDGRITQMVQGVVATAFAWMATPPR